MMKVCLFVVGRSRYGMYVRRIILKKAKGKVEQQ